MAITYHAGASADAVPSESINSDIGLQGNNRLVVVGTAAEANTTITCTVDGKAATLISRSFNPVGLGNTTHLFYILEAALGTSTGVVPITISGGGGVDDMTVATWYGVDQSAPSQFGIDNTSTGTSVTVTGINVPINGMAVMVAGSGGTGSISSLTSPMVQRQLVTGNNPTCLSEAIETSGASGKSYTTTFDAAMNRGSAVLAVWAEHSTISDGAGMTLASAELLTTTAGTQNPGAFDFEKSLPWGAITLALRKSTAQTPDTFNPGSRFDTISGHLTVADATNIDGWTLSGPLSLQAVNDLTNVTVNGQLDFEAAGTYNFSGCNVNEVSNSSGGAVTINLSGGSVNTNTGPNITILNTVTVRVTVRDAATGLPVVGARVLIEATSGGPLANGTQIINDVTDASGVVEDTAFNFSSNQPFAGTARKGTVAPFYKPGATSGTITSNGSDVTVFLVTDGS
jgi:hypothetical protein